MKYRSFTIVFLLFTLLLSCQREIGFVYLDQEPMLNVIARFSARDTVHSVMVSFSAGENLRRPPSSCIVRCSEGNTLLAESDSSWTGVDPYLQMHQLTMKVEPEHEYTLDVSVGSYHASVVAVAPPLYDGKVALGDTSYVKDGNGCRHYSRMDLVLDDVPGQRSYYVVNEGIGGIIRFWKDGKEIYSVREDNIGKLLGYPSSAEENASPYSAEVGQVLGITPVDMQVGLSFFSDYTFQDGQFVLQTEFSERPLVIDSYQRISNTSTYDSLTVEAIVQVGMVTAWSYEYQTLLAAAMQNAQSFVSEPVILPNRVQGGSGYFEILSAKEIFVDLGEVTPILYAY